MNRLENALIAHCTTFTNAVDPVGSLREYVAESHMSLTSSDEYKAETQRKRERKRPVDESSELMTVSASVHLSE